MIQGPKKYQKKVKMGGNGNRRRRIWVDGRFQARALILVVVSAVALLTVAGVLYVGVLDEQNRLMGIAALTMDTAQDDPGEAEFERELVAKTESDDINRLTVLAGLAILLVLVLAYSAVRVTFRAAGPAYAVAKMLSAIRVGNYSAVRPLRDGDQFMFLGDSVIALRDDLVRRESELSGKLTEVESMVASVADTADGPQKVALDRIAVKMAQLHIGIGGTGDAGQRRD